MVHDRANWRSKARRAALALTLAALPCACLGGASVYAQSIMRSPNLNIGSRIPSINSTVMPRIDPNIANLRARPACSYAYRDSNGECSDKPVSSADGGGSGGSSGKNKNRNKNSGPLSKLPQTVLNSRTIAGEIVAEIDGSLSDAQADELARRHRLERIGSQNFPLIGATIGLFRSVDRGRSRPIRASETSIAPGAYAGAWRQRHHRRYRFRNRHPTSRTCECDCRLLRCARQQGRPTCPRHRHSRRDRVACAADGERAGGEDLGDPRLRRGTGRRGKHLIRDPEGARLRSG